MIDTRAPFSHTVERAVTAIEVHTDAELIVVAAPRSGSYRDAAILWAALWVALLWPIAVWVPYTISPWTLMVELAGVFAGSAWVANRWLAVRWLTTKHRRAEQVRLHAQAAFTEEAVHGTPRRTGVLVYLSVAEQLVWVIPDAGIERRIPPALWDQAVQRISPRTLAGFVEGLRALGVLLAEHLPPQEGQVVNLPNAPRIRG